MISSKQIIAKILELPVTIALVRWKPGVIAITGSAGKTTCKELIGQLLADDFEVLVPSEGYNTEIGSPLAFFGEKTPENLRSIKSWVSLIMRIYRKAIFGGNFAEKVIVEMGADGPGDIKHLAKLFRPHVGVVLEVLPVHFFQFGNIEAIAAEKSELVLAIPKTGQVILNYDNTLVRAMANSSKATVTYFGTDKGVEGFRVCGLRSDVTGLAFDIIFEGKKHSFRAKLLGKHMVYPLLAAIVVAHSQKIPMDKIANRVSKLKAFKGRMNLVEGKSGSIIIDDSYNSNPASAVLALDFLAQQKGRRIALIGSMNELGKLEGDGHRQVGKKAATSADLIFTVGKPAEQFVITAAREAGFKEENMRAFTTAKEAGEHVAGLIDSGDIILAKGSQNGVRMERAVAEIMAQPEHKGQLLVRQSEFWENN